MEKFFEHRNDLCNIEVGRMWNIGESAYANSPIVSIVDRNVTEHWRERVGGRMIEIDAGEGCKSIDMARHLWERLVEMGATRQTVLVAVGGGTVCDLVGFVAATYMRGVAATLYLPTTLLAQVDAAIGGKCGVNFGGYKNMVGLFHFPTLTVCDIATLSTLPQREWRAGIAEVIKSAIVGSGELFELLERSTLAEIGSNEELCRRVVMLAVGVKSAIVERDPYDRGERGLLNLGHTWGHAIESLSQEYSHGEAVAAGIAYATRKALQEKMIDTASAERIINLLEAYHLPTEVDVPHSALKQAMLHDKKVDALRRLHFVLPTSIGRCTFFHEDL